MLDFNGGLLITTFFILQLHADLQEQLTVSRGNTCGRTGRAGALDQKP